MNSPEIRKTGPADIDELVNISIITFTQTFAKDNDPLNMEHYISESLTSEKLRSELENPGSEFYFSVIDGKTAGYLKLNFGVAQNELKDAGSMEIERIYILDEFQGQGLGQILLDFSIDIARRRNMKSVWLGVWEYNLKALRFYRKNGFEPFDKHIFKLGDDLQTDIMMRKTI